MSDAFRPQVAIVDYGMGNLFSVKHACEKAGMHATITASRDEILTANAVILPGVGAFGDAIQSLVELDLVIPLQDIAGSGKPLVGICLGMQLLMTESQEFGTHRGLGIIEGDVVRFDSLGDGSRRLKVPHVGWNRIHTPGGSTALWAGSPLGGLPGGTFMYFVHSYYPRPADTSLVLAMTRYGHIEFCSSLRRGNIFACQFHPERSGPEGLHIYRNLAALARMTNGGEWNVREVGSKVRTP